MEKSKIKWHGRVKINRLDWFLAIACCIFGFSALWISLGISIANCAPYAINALTTFGRGLGFLFQVEYGQGVVVSAIVCVVFYEALLFLCVGIIYLLKTKQKDRIPGIFAIFVTLLGVALYLSFAFEFLNGKSAGVVNMFWPITLYILVVIQLLLAGFGAYITFNHNIVIELPSEVDEDANEFEEAEPVYEEILDEEEKLEEPVEEVQPEEEISEEAIQDVVEEEPIVEETTEEQPVEETPVQEDEVQEEEPQEVVQEETTEPVIIPEELVEEEEEEAEEDFNEDEESDEEVELDENGNPFGNLGPRRKRIPFENKIKRSKPETRERYKIIVDALREFDFNDRKSIPCETFSFKKEKLIVLAFSGSTLKAFFRLNPAEYEDSPIPVKDATDVKKYQETPAYLVIKSDLAARRAVMLAERIAEERGIPKK